jgi:E3 ubiquitin-protein ligase HERC2
LSHGDQAGIEAGHHGCSLPVLQRLKNHVIALAGGNPNLGAVQVTAQAVLQLAWSLLLPTASERASALATLLQRDDEYDSCMSTERCISLACHHLRSFRFVFKVVDVSWPIYW